MKVSSLRFSALGVLVTLLVACGSAAPTAAPGGAGGGAGTTTTATTATTTTTAAATTTTTTGAAATRSGPVRLTDGKVVLAVLNDQSGIYADLSGKNTTKAVQMAVDDFKAKYGANALGGPIEVIDADHQNKPDVANTRAQEFYDRNGADLILDVPTSSAALAVAGVAKSKKKLHINIGAATTELTGAQCNKYTFHYAYDTWMLANGTGTYITQKVGKKWYILYPNYAFGQDMDRSFQDAIKRSGGSVVTSEATPFPSTDFSSFLLKVPSARPDVLGVMQAGGELITIVKQYNEFKLKDQKIPLAIGLMFDTDIKGIGSDPLAGTVYTTAWQWNMDDQARGWADKFKAQTGTRPTFAHAGNYSAAYQYLEAILRAGTDEADPVVAALEGYSFNDFFMRNGKVRAEDHRVIHDVYQAEVKPSRDVKEDFDFTKILNTIPADQAFRPADQAGCRMER
ncbi:MAG: ABC transporter substrate-binding protein [Chloroflexota bacterium]|nr:ABC transporter substrate-binding protein [Chloroflexota bacterium]